MGGPNSTRWGDYEPKPRVENAPVVLDITELGHLEPGTVGTLKWGKPGKPQAVAPFIIRQEGTHRVVALQLRVFWSDQEPANQEIHLVPLPMPQGGVRWLAECPVCRDRRAVKLYIPPDGTKLMCRVCAGLLYKSSQKSDPRISVLASTPKRRFLDTSPSLPIESATAPQKGRSSSRRSRSVCRTCSRAARYSSICASSWEAARTRL